MSDAEESVMRELRQQCPADWVILHSLWLREHPIKSHAEADIVLITDQAVLLLEIKGGTVRRQDDEWYFETKAGKLVKVSREGPFDQMRSAFYALRDHMNRIGHLNLFHDVVWGYGVITPECQLRIPRTDTLIEPMLWLDLSGFPDNLMSFINDMTEHWRKHNLRLKANNGFPASRLRQKLTVAERHQLRDLLRPAIMPVVGLGAEARLADLEIARLTRNQIDALQAISINPRIVLTGAAGTGKTVLALTHAITIARETPNIRVLFVCFSRLLADHLGRRLASIDAGSNLTVGTYHQVVGGLLKLAGKRSVPSEDWETFNAGLTDSVMEALDSLSDPDTALYDVIVIDEAQDLMHPQFFGVIELLLRGGLQNGRWLLSLDPSQAVFQDHFQRDLHSTLMQSAVVLKLTVNCRNTRQVAAYVTGLSDCGEILARTAEGPDVEIIYYESRAQLEAELKSTVNKLIGDKSVGKLAPEDVVILTPDQSMWPPKLFDAGFFIRPTAALRSNHTNNAVRIGTIHGFKGMESSCIILLGFTEMDTQNARRLLYVGGSRAKSILKMFFPFTVQDSLARAFPKILKALQASSDETTWDI